MEVQDLTQLSTAAGTEKLYVDDGGVDNYILARADLAAIVW